MRCHLSRAGFFLHGGCSLIAQLIVLQELAIVFAGHELFLGVSLAAWMGWVGLGSWLARRRPSDALPMLVTWSLPLVVANLFLIRLSKCLFGFGMLIGLAPMAILTVALLAPIGLAVGAVFSWGCIRAERHRACSLGQAYGWEAFGAACGGVLWTALIAGRLSPAWTVAALALPTAAVAWTLSARRARPLRLAVPAVAILVILSPVPSWIRQAQWRGYEVLAERHSRYSHLVVAKTGSLTSLFDNGVLAAHFPDPAAYEGLVHWTLLAHTAPRRILIIGGAAAGSLTELLKHPVARVDYVELDPMVVQMLTPALPSLDRAALHDPRVRLLHHDGRRFLARTEERYDVILLHLPPPLNAQINRLYTLEAFRTIRSRLAPGGLLAFTIPSSENYLSPDTLYFNACLYQTLTAAFPSVELVAGDPLLLVAGLREVHLDPSVLSRRYEERRLRTREVVPSALPITLDPQRRDALAAQLTAIRPPLNRDFEPVCYTAAFRVWLSKFISPAYFLGALLLMTLAVVLLRAVWRRRAVLMRAPGPTALGCLGAAGIVYETVLLLAFQALAGSVYWQLGSLFAAFMLGLALGSWWSERHLASHATPHAQRTLQLLLIAAAAEGGLLAWLLPAFQRLSTPVPWLVPFSLLLLATGAVPGLAFPLAGRLSAPEDVARAAGTLYAADLWGAAVGAVLTSAFAVPMMGLVPTVGITGFLLLVSACVLASNPQSAFRNPHFH